MFSFLRFSKQCRFLEEKQTTGLLSRFLQQKLSMLSKKDAFGAHVCHQNSKGNRLPKLNLAAASTLSVSWRPATRTCYRARKSSSAAESEDGCGCRQGFAFHFLRAIVNIWLLGFWWFHPLRSFDLSSNKVIPPSVLLKASFRPQISHSLARGFSGQPHCNGLYCKHFLSSSSWKYVKAPV